MHVGCATRGRAAERPSMHELAAAHRISMACDSTLQVRVGQRPIVKHVESGVGLDGALPVYPEGH